MSTNRLNEYRILADPNQSPIVRKGTNERLIESTQDVPNEDTILVDVEKDGKKVKEQVQIRFIASCPSIFVKEQIDTYKIPRDYKFSTADLIWINGGKLLVGEQKANLTEYLDKCSYNRDSPYRRSDAGVIFYKMNPVAVAEGEVENSELKLEAMQVVINAKKDTALLERIGKHFGFDESFTHVEIMADLIKKAERNPELVMKAVAQHQVTLAHTIEEAKTLNVIDFAPGKIVWKNTDQAIVSFRANFSPEEGYAALEKHLASKKGEADLALLKSQVAAERKTELASIN